MLTMRLVKSLYLTTCFSVVIFPCYSIADIAIIIHPSNINQLSLTKIKKIFLSKSYTFSDGSKAVPFAPASESLRKFFVKSVLQRTESSLHSYWARILFSSKGRPPVILKDVSSVKRMVATNPQAIAYIDIKDIDDTVKVVLIVKHNDR